jgi:hypothetical protein
MLPGATGRIIMAFIAFLLSWSVVTYAQAEVAPRQGYWYLGEGAQEGMSLTYRIQQDIANASRVFDMMILLNSTNADGSWLANFAIVENGSRLTGYVLLRDVDLYPLSSLDNSTGIASYFDEYEQSIQYLGRWSTKSDPLSIGLQGSWGGLACDGCPRAGPKRLESINITAGTFNTTLVNWLPRFNIWVLDDFPFPLKGQTVEFLNIDSSLQRVSHSFELVEASINGSVIPEFSQILVGLPFGIVLVTLLLRLWHQPTSNTPRISGIPTRIRDRWVLY